MASAANAYEFKESRCWSACECGVMRALAVVSKNIG